MNRLVYVFVSFALLLFLAPIVKAQGTYTAASCNYSDVNAVVNGPTHRALNGDTINIPAGRCAWSSTLNINVAITLQGAGAVSSTSWVPGTGTTKTGTDQTVINPAVGGNSTIVVNSASGNPEMRITGIALLENSGSGDAGGGIIHLNGNATNVRIDHCHFYTSQSSKVILIGGSVTGVADHNFMDILVNTIGLYYAFYNGVGWNGLSDPGGYGDPSYADGDNWGTSKFFYVEDNYLDGEGTGANNGNYVMDCVNGGRGVIRYSTALNTQGNASHGLSSGANRGCRAMEVYQNYYNYSPNHAGPIAHPNSGTTLVWGNVSTGMSNIVGTQMERILSNEGNDSEEVPAAPNGWGYCGTKYATGTATASSTTVTGTGFSTSWPAPFNMIIPGATCESLYGNMTGSVCKVASVQSSTALTLAQVAQRSVSGVTYTVGSPWDGGTNSVGYPCLDSPGRGIGDLLNGANFPGRVNTVTKTQTWPHQALSPIYIWDNDYTATGSTGQGIIFEGTGTLADNRDYYQQFGAYGESGTFNGTAGVGQGSSLPSVAQPTCTPSSNPIAASGFPISGNWGPGYWDTANSTLYVCTATNTWTPYYTPFTYPHPLTAGGSGDPPPNPPTGLSATVQ